MAGASPASISHPIRDQTASAAVIQLGGHVTAFWTRVGPRPRRMKNQPTSNSRGDLATSADKGALSNPSRRPPPLPRFPAQPCHACSGRHHARWRDDARRRTAEPADRHASGMGIRRVLPAYGPGDAPCAGRWSPYRHPAGNLRALWFRHKARGRRTRHTPGFR
jgi:hypothetical protein